MTGKILLRLWLVGRSNYDPEGTWEFLGIFSSEAAALKRCLLPNDFIATVDVDGDVPLETMPFPGAYYPKGEK
jgi:hypothetical protein